MGRRGRPSASRASEIDAVIHNAALALFLEHGFHAVTMDMLAEKAQVSKATLYTRYEGKAEMLDAVVKREVLRLLEGAQQTGRSMPEGLDERLLYHGRNIICSQDWSDVKRLDQLINSVSSERPDIHRTPYEVILGHITNYLAEDFRQVAEAAGYRLDNYHFLAEFFFHSIFGWHQAKSTVGQVNATEVEEYIGRVVAITLMAIRDKVV